MSIEDAIAAAVEARLSKRLERIEKALALGGGDDLCSVPKAAKAVGLHPSTVRAQYLKRLTVYGHGKLVRISVSELRAVLRNEAGGDADLEARAASIAASKRGRRQ
jgi:hypothetical protein